MSLLESFKSGYERGVKARELALATKKPIVHPPTRTIVCGFLRGVMWAVERKSSHRGAGSAKVLSVLIGALDSGWAALEASKNRTDSQSRPKD